MEEGLISWLFLLVMLCVLFRYLSKRKPTASTLLRFIAVGICIAANIVFSIGVHWILMNTWDVDTTGFLNLNDLFVFVGCWIAVALAALILIRRFAKRLGGVYRTALATQAILLVLPLASFLIFFLLAMAE